jgi:uncharacterized protein (TIGR03083 family)
MPDEVVTNLIDEWSTLRALLDQLDDADWRTPTALPGWSVQDCVSHITGTERMIMGDPAPEVAIAHLDHVKNPFGEIVEVWVEQRRSWTPQQVLAEFDEHIPRRIAELRAMTEQELTEPTESPLGVMPYRNFLEVRIFDTWMHEQDIRRAVDRPGHLDGPIVDAALIRFRGALGYVVGKKAGAPDGASVVIELVGGPGGAIAVAVDGRAYVVDDIPDDPTVRIVVPFEDFVALGGGRRAAADLPDDALRVEGDHDLGRRVLDAMAFTP